MMSIYTMRGNITGGCFSRTMIEGWIIRRHYYMLRGGVSTLIRSKILLRLGIWYNFSVITGRRLFGNW